LKLGSPADCVAPGLPMGSREFSPDYCRPAGRLDRSLQALTCELSSRFEPGRRVSFRPMSCGEVNSPLQLHRICQRDRTRRSAFGPQSLKDPVRLTWHAQLNCQRALSPAQGGAPIRGKIGKAYARGHSYPPQGLSTNHSVG